MSWQSIADLLVTFFSELIMKQTQITNKRTVFISLAGLLVIQTNAAV